MLHTSPDLSGSGRSGSTISKVAHMPLFLATSSASFGNPDADHCVLGQLLGPPLLLALHPVLLPGSLLPGQQTDVSTTSMSRDYFVVSSLQIMSETSLLRTSLSHRDNYSITITSNMLSCWRGYPEERQILRKILSLHRLFLLDILKLVFTPV